MESNSLSSVASDPAAGSLTIVSLILIALLALVVIGVIVLATRIRARAARQRLDASKASERLAGIHEVDAPAAAPAISDVPVVAAAPLDAAPATLAGDMEPARATPDATGDADDLTRMKGVGPKLASQLAALGYTRFAQIAALSAIETDALDAQLGAFKGRLARDRVVEQAGYLAKGDTAGFEAVFGKL